MDEIPSAEECIDLIKKAGCPKKVIKHSQAVKKLALKISKGTDADERLVEAGALLHDIGRCRTHGIKHAVEGVKIAKEYGLPESILKIIERHIGAGIDKKEAVRLNLPAKNYVPISLEEKIVCHADNLIENTSRQKIEKEVEKVLEQGNKKYAKRLVKLHHELCRKTKKDLNKI